jgi:hypothetical protein
LNVGCGSSNVACGSAKDTSGGSVGTSGGSNPWLDAGVVDAGRQHDRRIFHTVFDRL